MLPSYADATSHDHWNVVAPYVGSNDLCSAALVCNRWHEIFAPHLWGNPASHFGVENDSVYVALTKFKRTLPLARFYVRQLTHTLHLPPAHAELYEGPHADWLLTVLRRLPNLQCLIVDDLPFFDHAALLYLRRAVTTVGGSSIAPAEFSLRLLNARGCLNSTSLGLSETLIRLPNLVFLDLSYTASARDPKVLQALSRMSNLQFLGLRATDLTDEDVMRIGECTGLSLRTLDVRDNALSDLSAGVLLQHCFRYAAPRAGCNETWQLPYSRYGPFDGPGGLVGVSQSMGIESIVRNRLLLGLPLALAIEHSAMTGILNLFASGNNFTTTGIANVLQTSRIQILDVGRVDGHDFDPLKPGQDPVNASKDVLASGELLKLMDQFCSASMTYLRIHHSIVTGDVNWSARSPEVLEMQGSRGRYVSSHAQELGLSSHRPLSTSQTPAPAELADSGPEGRAISSPSSTPSGVGELPGDIPDPTFTCGFRNLDLEDKAGEKAKIIHHGGTTPMMPQEPGPGPSLSEHEFGQRVQRSRSYSTAKRKREDFVKGQRSTAPFLTPIILPHLAILVLTEVPERTETPTVHERLIALIRCCASLTALASEEAHFSYQHPPGQSKRAFERAYMKSIIGLDRIVIELAAPEKTALQKASWRRRAGKSTTEDQDSEAFWSAAEHDFTFFDEDECGLPVERQQGLFCMGHENDETSRQVRTEQGRRASAQAGQKPTYDVVAQVAAFRTDRKQAFESAVKSGVNPPSVEGHWFGEVQIVRP